MFMLLDHTKNLCCCIRTIISCRTACPTNQKRTAEWEPHLRIQSVEQESLNLSFISESTGTENLLLSGNGGILIGANQSFGIEV